MKRILIFSHYNKLNNLSEYVLYWLDELTPLFEKIIFVSNSSLSQDDEDKIKKYASKIIMRKNTGYDFAAWRDGILQEGFETLEKYDSLTLMNDTCFGPFYDIGGFYKKMEGENVDFWGNTNHKKCHIEELGPCFEIQEHVQSYFIVFNQNVIKSNVFRSFWKNIDNEKEVFNVIKKYETQLTYKLTERGFKYKTLIDVTQKQYSSMHPNIAYVYPLVLLEENSPFLKVKNFLELSHLLGEIKEFIKGKTLYPINLIEEHMKDVYGCLEKKHSSGGLLHGMAIVAHKIIGRLKTILYFMAKLCYNLLPNVIKNIAVINKIKEKLCCSDCFKKINDHERATGLTNAGRLSAERYAMLNGINFSILPNNRKTRISLITDSIGKGSFFGGVATSIIFAALWAKKIKADLRLITRVEATNVEEVSRILEANDINLNTTIETIFYPCHATKKLEVLENEVFITTSWWTTQVIINSGLEHRIFYLLQEDERMFYPLGDDYLMASKVMKNNNIHVIVNSFLLYQHLVLEGFDNIKENGLYFEPSVDSKHYYCEESKDKEKHDFFFYARPNHLRNIFYYGQEHINLAIQRGILDPKKWHFNYVGANIPKDLALKNVSYSIHDTVPWADYAKLVRNADLALSLMISPHTSYPPLDIAASGGVVVTNKWGIKKDLKMYSKNIICSDMESDALLNSLSEGVKLALNKEDRWQNFKNNTICSNWEKSFEEILFKISSFL